jgi:hypothetical protein
LLHNGSTTGVRWIKDIYEKSDILPKLYDENGTYKNVVLDDPEMLVVPLPLAPGRFSEEYIDEIERVDKPLGFEAEFGLLPTGHARHHIIPAGDMGFLWFMGEENDNIRHLLQDISYKKLGTIESVEWAPWNLFIGPDNRPRDPVNGDPGEGAEPIRPLSYSEPLWNKIQILYQQIQKCWEERRKLSFAISSETADSITANFRSKEIDEMESGNSKNLGEMKLKKTSKTTSIVDAKKQYLSTQKELFYSLVEIRKITHRNMVSSPHPYAQDDWEETSDNKHLVKTNQAKPKKK